METAIPLLIVILCVVWLSEHQHARHHHTTKLVLRFGGYMDPILDSITLAINASETAFGVPVEADGVTITPGAVVSNQSWSISDSSIVTVSDNDDGSLTVLAVGPGVATVVLSATVTDADGTVNTFSATGTVTVTGDSTGRSAGLKIAFTATAPATTATTARNPYKTTRAPFNTVTAPVARANYLANYQASVHPATAYAPINANAAGGYPVKK